MGLVELYTGILGEPDTNNHSTKMKGWQQSYVYTQTFFRQIYFCYECYEHILIWRGNAFISDGLTEPQKGFGHVNHDIF